MGVVVQIDLKTNRNFKRINWAHNKRFLFGSIVLFTKDNCKSLIAATIVDRDVNLLSCGKVGCVFYCRHLWEGNIATQHRPRFLIASQTNRELF